MRKFSQLGFGTHRAFARDMSTRAWTAWATLLFFTVGCSTTTTQIRYDEPIYEHRLTREPTAPTLSASGLRFSAGVLSGTLMPNAVCRDVPTKISNGQVVQVTKGNPRASAVLLVASALVVAGSGLVLGSADSYSDDKTCNETHYEDWKGDIQHGTSCTSPRGEAIAVGVTGLLLGASGVVAAVVGMRRRPTERVVGVAAPLVEPNGPPMGPPTSCLHDKSMDGLVVALEDDRRVLDYATIDQSGALKFTVPESARRQLRIVVANVPPQLQGEVEEGAVVAQFERPIEIPANSDNGSSGRQ